jgi:hypothetical protein
MAEVRVNRCLEGVSHWNHALELALTSSTCIAGLAALQRDGPIDGDSGVNRGDVIKVAASVEATSSFISLEDTEEKDDCQP